jgi:hypothetical protein
MRGMDNVKSRYAITVTGSQIPLLGYGKQIFILYEHLLTDNMGLIANSKQA